MFLQYFDHLLMISIIIIFRISDMLDILVLFHNSVNLNLNRESKHVFETADETEEEEFVRFQKKSSLEKVR